MTNFYTIEVKDNKINVLEQNAEYTTDYVEELLNRINTLELIAKNQSTKITDLQSINKCYENELIEKDKEINELELDLGGLAHERSDLLDLVDELQNKISDLEEVDDILHEKNEAINQAFLILEQMQTIS